MHGIFMRENREVPWSPGSVPVLMVRLVIGAAGREGNAEAVIP